MPKDFTIKMYELLLRSLLQKSYSTATFLKFLKSDLIKALCLRHDVDQLPLNSLSFAIIQYKLGLQGTYFFRADSGSWDEAIIKRIHVMGHEIGYHYECLATARGDIKKAIVDFEYNLNKLRNLVPVSTICMHGSPSSKYDSRELWKHYDYRDFGIIGEPYFDIDFNNTAYYTDTGRMWDGQKYSVRDKVQNNKFPSYHTTFQIIDAINAGTFPKRAMLTFHPQRWANKPLPWLKELLWQHTKNNIKYFLIKARNK